MCVRLCKQSEAGREGVSQGVMAWSHRVENGLVVFARSASGGPRRRFGVPAPSTTGHSSRPVTLVRYRAPTLLQATSKTVRSRLSITEKIKGFTVALKSPPTGHARGG